MPLVIGNSFLEQLLKLIAVQGKLQFTVTNITIYIHPHLKMISFRAEIQCSGLDFR